MTTRRRLAASALPMIFAVAATRAALAKSAGPDPAGACRAGVDCHAGKAGFTVDDGSAGPCPYCAGLAAAGKK